MQLRRYLMKRAADYAADAAALGDQGLYWLWRHKLDALRSVKDVPQYIYDTVLRADRSDFRAMGRGAGAVAGAAARNAPQVLHEPFTPQGGRYLQGAAGMAADLSPLTAVPKDIVQNLAGSHVPERIADKAVSSRESPSYHGGGPLTMALQLHRAMAPAFRPTTYVRAARADAGQGYLAQNLRTRWSNLADEVARPRMAAR